MAVTDASDLELLDPIEIMRQIVQLADATTQHSLERAGYTSLTRSHAVVLLLLDKGILTPKELRNQLGVTQQFVSKCLKVLAEDGSVAMVSGPVDKRRRDVQVTQRGKRAISLIKARRERVLSVLAEDLARAAAISLRDLEEQVRDELELLDSDD